MLLTVYQQLMRKCGILYFVKAMRNPLCNYPSSHQINL